MNDSIACQFREAVPTVEDYCQLRVLAGLSAKTREAAARALPNTLFGVCAYQGSELVAMGRIVGDGGCQGLRYRGAAAAAGAGTGQGGDAAPGWLDAGQPAAIGVRQPAGRWRGASVVRPVWFRTHGTSIDRDVSAVLSRNRGEAIHDGVDLPGTCSRSTPCVDRAFPGIAGKEKPRPKPGFPRIGVPTGIRTPVATVKG